jgi:hypothetical protein
VLLATLALLAVALFAISQRLSLERAQAAISLTEANAQASSEGATMALSSELPGALALSPHVALPTATQAAVMTPPPFGLRTPFRSPHRLPPVVGSVASLPSTHLGRD